MLRKVVVFTLLFVLVYGSTTAVLPARVQAQNLTPQERAVLQAQYDELQKEIAVQEKIIKDTQAKKNTLQGDVTLLNAQIKAAQAQIDAKNISIRQLSEQIVKKNVVIGQLSERIERGRESLASVLRQTQVMDDFSVVSIALGSSSVSAFFSDLDSFASITNDLKTLFMEIRETKAQTESEKADLALKQSQTADAKYVVEVKQKQISSDKTQKQQLLTITANQEAEYKKVLAERQAKAAAIRAALFPLRDAAAIQFGDALKYAKQAEARTGVRPALILAVLTQESNLGQNVGQCFLKNNTTGAGVGKNTGNVFARVMNPTRDVPPFIALGLQLGFDPHNQAISCPIASAGGWGGAMGPAQFIASTWAGYAKRVATARSVPVANPWDPQDAIMAMSLYLGDLGAGAGGYTAEHRASAKYYAGSRWATAGKAYGNSVLSLATSIQNNIDFLSDN
jgi:peptidoglycan hydrolase CwlO-like protein